jgi:hypothetical protein
LSYCVLVRPRALARWVRLPPSGFTRSPRCQAARLVAFGTRRLAKVFSKSLGSLLYFVHLPGFVLLNLK